MQLSEWGWRRVEIGQLGALEPITSARDILTVGGLCRDMGLEIRACGGAATNR